MRNIPMLADLDVRFRVMDTFGEDYQQVFSLPTPPIEGFAKNFAPRVALDLARAANDGMAELVQKYPARFPGFVAALPLGQPDTALAELHRAVDDLGARGFQIHSHI